MSVPQSPKRAIQRPDPLRIVVAKLIYTAMYSGHDVPRWEDAPAWRKHRAIVAAGLVIPKVQAGEDAASVVTIPAQRDPNATMPPKPLRERIAERRAG